MYFMHEYVSGGPGQPFCLTRLCRKNSLYSSRVIIFIIIFVNGLTFWYYNFYSNYGNMDIQERALRVIKQAWIDSEGSLPTKFGCVVPLLEFLSYDDVKSQ